MHLTKVKQTTVNVKVTDEFRHGFDVNLKLKKDIAHIQKHYQDMRIVVRPSGTESVIRIMVEGDESMAKEVIEKIKTLLVTV